MIEKLAYRLGRNDEVPNIELAELLCQNEDVRGISAIVEGLKGRDKAIANDCIKVLYEIGYRKPFLIKNILKHDVLLSPYVWYCNNTNEPEKQEK